MPMNESARKTAAEIHIIRRCAFGPTVNPQTIENDQIPFARWNVAERIPST